MTHCPFSDGHAYGHQHSSFFVNLVTGKWIYHGRCRAGNGAVTLEARSKRIDYGEAQEVERLSRRPREHVSYAVSRLSTFPQH